MVKILLEKTIFGYKLMVSDNAYSFIRQSNKIKKRFGIYPKQVIGYIIRKSDNQYSNNNYIFAIDLNQLYLWLLLGGRFSKSFYKFSYFFRDFIYINKI